MTGSGLLTAPAGNIPAQSLMWLNNHDPSAPLYGHYLVNNMMASITAPDRDLMMIQGPMIGVDFTGRDKINEQVRFRELAIYHTGSETNGSTTELRDVYALNQSIAGIFNALMWKRNGPFGYPTWKQIRGGEHVLATAMRKNNRYVVVDPQSDRIVPPKPGTWGPVAQRNIVDTGRVVQAFKKLGHINTAERKHNHYYIPVFDTSAKTMLAAIQRGRFNQVATGPGGTGMFDYSIEPDRMLYAIITLLNNLKNFPKWKLNEDLGLRNYKKERTAYHDLREMYTEMVDLEGNDAYTCLLYTSPSPRDRTRSRMPSSA